jgi:hypothetical protein
MRLSPGELELGRGAGRGEDGGRGAKAEVLEDPADDGSVGEERDELALAAATRGQVSTSISKTRFKSSAQLARFFACSGRSARSARS